MIRQPTAATLRKYGLILADWRVILARQGSACAVCGQVPSTGRLVIDHVHTPGWKRLKPASRKLRVRGLLCWYCNHAYVGRGITLEKARGVVRYLEAYENRKPAAGRAMPATSPAGGNAGSPPAASLPSSGEFFAEDER